MFITVTEHGALALEDARNFRGFSIKPERAGMKMPSEFNDMATDAGEGRYWLDADAVIALSGHADDPDWCAQFWAMLRGAEPHGFADLANRRVKAHVDRPD